MSELFERKYPSNKKAWIKTILRVLWTYPSLTRELRFVLYCPRVHEQLWFVRDTQKPTGYLSSISQSQP